ncbi:MAG: DUF6268 family outer membrane beta-barrel protein [Candidatus Euphemobacter frigidus]|nr:DUF6268 family outer membrane beta-barrel protein [Candidatus Euphemobacter frigidus]MDP8276120.1 DUF6268 family outer membrane beta-barrel protein [Candidatus Euphemobacter frigidus]
MRTYWFRLGIIVLEGILLLSIIHPAAAWEEDKVAYLRYYYVPHTELKDEDGEIEMNAFKGMALIPVALGESMFLLPGLAYSGLYLDYKGMTFSDPGPEGPFTEKDLPRNLHVIDLIIGAHVQWDQEWGTFVLLYPGIHSDLDDISGDDIYFSGVALASYRFSDTLLCSVGFYYDDSFGVPQLLPMIGVQWQISDVLTLDAFLPQFLVFKYRADPVLAIGLKFNVEGNQYRLSKGKPWKDTRVKYTQILAGPFVDLNLADHLVLRIEGGFVADREFEFYDDDTSSRLFDGDIKDSGYVGGSLALQY